MKDRFNLKQECIFVSLASYAHDIITQGDIYAFDGEAMFIARAIDTHFKKKIKRYSKNRINKLTSYLNDVMGPAFPDKMNASIIMVASLHYLIGEEEHYETKLVFSPFKYKIQSIISTLEKSEFKDELKKANETLVKMLDDKPTNFKTNIDKDIAIKHQHTLLKLLEYLINNTVCNDKLFKPFEKLKKILEPYKEVTTNKEVLIEISPNNKDNIYYIVAVLESLKSVISNKLECIDKFKKINLNYLVPDKFMYNQCSENIKNILL